MAQSLGLWVSSFAFAILTFTLAQAATDPAAGTRIPQVRGTSFSGTEVRLPEALAGKKGVLVLGFSRGATDAVTAWGKRLAADYYDSPNLLHYEMPVLESVPKFMRGIVVGRIKASVSDRGKAHFVPLLDNEQAWRAVADYSAPNDAYVLVVDSEGNVVWRTHGLPTDASFSALKQQVEGVRSYLAVPAVR